MGVFEYIVYTYQSDFHSTDCPRQKRVNMGVFEYIVYTYQSDFHSSYSTYV